MTLQKQIKEFEEKWNVRIDEGRTRWDTVVIKCFMNHNTPMILPSFLIDAMWVGKGVISYSTDIGRSPYLSLEFIKDFQKFVRKVREIDEHN